MDNEAKLKIEERIIDMLKTVYDPEIPVNVYDLGLIYKIDLQDDGELTIDMTLTAPNCPAAEFIMEDVRQKVESVDGVKSCASQSGVRTGMGQGYDDRRSKTGAGLPVR